MAKIFVVGSLNIDLVMQTSILPKAGETRYGDHYFQNYGGKGANQAIAAFKMGADVKIIGSVGQDAFGLDYQHYLKDLNIHTHLAKSPTHTGVAIILVTENDNRILLSPGANEALTLNTIEEGLKDASPGDLYITQFENPLPVIHAGLKMAKDKGMITILNPAPMQKNDIIGHIDIDILILNEVEIEPYLNTQTFESLAIPHVNTIILTLGDKGLKAKTEGVIVSYPAHRVSIIDTTAAGDSFVGAFAAMIAANKPFERALNIANAAAGLACTSLGAQQSMKIYTEVISFLGSEIDD